MPRDSFGNYNLPGGTLVNTGDTILVSQHNPAMQDIAQSLTNSLDRDGNGTMRANLGMGGNRITNAAPGVADTDVATVGQLTTGSGVPVGAVIDYWGTTPPEGFLFAAGQEVSRSTYAVLFAVIGTAGGVGNGSTTFNIPDYRAVVAAGKADMGGSLKSLLSNFAGATLGAIFGTQSHTLTVDQMPSHTHVLNDPGHRHTGATTSPVGGGVGSNDSVVLSNTGLSTTGITINNAGNGQAHPNVQPTIICNKIIRVS